MIDYNSSDIEREASRLRLVSVFTGMILLFVAASQIGACTANLASLLDQFTATETAISPAFMVFATSKAAAEVLPPLATVTAAISFLTMRDGSQLFSHRFVKRLGVVAAICLVSALIGALANVLFVYLAATDAAGGATAIFISPSASLINVDALAVAIILFAVSRILAYGVMLQNVSDGTV